MDYPKVFIAIPTGAIKEYAALYMLASLKNIDYPNDKLSINIAVTTRKDNKHDLGYTKRLQALIDNAKISFTVTVTNVYPTKNEMERWGQYYAVICNLHELRKQFLDSDNEYFWVLGGDNPPPRHCLKNLLKIGADVNSAAVWQRPNRAKQYHIKGAPVNPEAEPIYFVHLWRMEDVQKRKDLDPRLKEALRKCLINLPMIQQITTDRNLTIYNVSFGSGCSLSKREVIEHVGYYLTEAAYCSEDLSFIQWSQTLGFNNGLNLGLHCGHFDANGVLY